MQISKGEYIVESVATTNFIEPSFLMEDENFINEARLMSIFFKIIKKNT